MERCCTNCFVWIKFSWIFKLHEAFVNSKIKWLSHWQKVAVNYYDPESIVYHWQMIQTFHLQYDHICVISCHQWQCKLPHSLSAFVEKCQQPLVTSDVWVLPDSYSEIILNMGKHPWNQEHNRLKIGRNDIWKNCRKWSHSACFRQLEYR